MSDAVRAAIDRHLATVLERGVDPSRFGPEADLREDLGLSSLEAVGLCMALEDEFELEVSDEEVAGLRRLGDAVRLIEAKRAERLAS
jgi:acyl carrier protein